MIPEHLKDLIEDIAATINDGSLAKHEREDRLWELAQGFWEQAFPAGMSPEDRHSVWVAVVAECDPETCQNATRILDVLEWPATGAPPTWT